jgi:hypothetical protein
MGIFTKGVESRHVGNYTVANLPTVATLPTLTAGDIAYATNALKAAETTGNGTGNLVFWGGAGWFRVDTGAAAAA